MSGAGAGTDSSADMAREALRRLVSVMEKDSLEAVFKEDPDFTREMLEALPRVLEARVTLTRVLCEYMEALPSEDRSALVRGMVADLDGGILGEAANSLSRSLMAVHRENPDLAAVMMPAIEAAVSETDFGKLRVAFTDAVEFWSTLTEKAVELAAYDPVVIANLVGMLPPLLNSLIGLLSKTVASIDLPSEVLASAVFNTLLSIDTAEVGRVLTGLSGLVKQLHEGNLVLGGEEPRFRSVLHELLDGVLENLDVEATADALSALGEDSEVVMGVLGEILSRDTGLLMDLSSAIVKLSNSVLRGVSGLFRELGRLSDEDLARWGEISSGLDVGEAARVLNSALLLSRRFTDASPRLWRRMLAELVASVDREQLVAVAGSVASHTAEVLLADEGVKRALEPEAVGKRLNDLVVLFNRSAVLRPGEVAGYVTRMLSAVDGAELRTAVRKVARGMLSAAWGGIRIIFSTVRKK